MHKQESHNWNTFQYNDIFGILNVNYILAIEAIICLAFLMRINPDQWMNVHDVFLDDHRLTINCVSE